MDTDVILVLLGIILTSIISQTTAVWVKFISLEKRLAEIRVYLEKKIDQNKCPFGNCPLYERARSEAASERTIGE